jgi:hypothetical protein
MFSKRIKFLVGVLFISSFISCASKNARMVEWREDEMTVCCDKPKCGGSDWQDAAAKYCTGESTMIGGESRDRVSSYESKTDDGKTVMNPNVTRQGCRIFKCNGNILPPEVAE